MKLYFRYSCLILFACATFMTNPTTASVIWTADNAVIIKKNEAKAVINNVDASRPSAISPATLKLLLSHAQTEIRNFALLCVYSMIVIISTILVH
jgi:hypothetical protein